MDKKEGDKDRDEKGGKDRKECREGKRESKEIGSKGLRRKRIRAIRARKSIFVKIRGLLYDGFLIFRIFGRFGEVQFGSYILAKRYSHMTIQISVAR